MLLHMSLGECSADFHAAGTSEELEKHGNQSGTFSSLQWHGREAVGRTGLMSQHCPGSAKHRTWPTVHRALTS